MKRKIHPLLGTRAPLESVHGSHPSPAPEQTTGGGAQGQNHGDETVCCLLAKYMVCTSTDSCSEERSGGLGEKWIADSGASFHMMTHSADILRGVRLCDGVNVRIGDNSLVDEVGYGAPTVVLPGYISGCQAIQCGVRDGHRIEHNFANNGCSYYNKRGVRFTTEEGSFWVSLFYGRLRFEGDGSSCFWIRIHGNTQCHEDSLRCLHYVGPGRGKVLKGERLSDHVGKPSTTRSQIPETPPCTSHSYIPVTPLVGDSTREYL